MKIIIKIATLLLAIGCTYIAKSQACTGSGNIISSQTTSSALGSNNTVSVNNSTAIGKNNTISYTTSTNPSYTIGNNNNMTKPYSIALGSNINVNASSSIAIGYLLKNTTDYGITIGKGNTTSQQLINNTNGIMMGMNSNISTFFISSSIGINHSGRIGIGNTTNPQAKLHIKADSSGEGEDADIMLEPTASGKYAAIYFKTADNYIRMRNTAGLDFNAPRFNFQTGKVGIGNVSAPQATLHIKANSGENANIMLQTTDNTKDAAIIFRNTSNTISVGSNNLMNFAATSYSFTTGKVGIGCINNMNDFALAVQGGVICAKMSVLDIDSWPDFVFRNNYKLMNLYELEQYINTNQHLPDVPAAQEVSANGIDLGEMNSILLQKVEELTLHIIELQKQIDELKAR